MKTGLGLLGLSLLPLAVAAPVKLDLSNTRYKATITVPAGTKLTERVAGMSWQLDGPNDFTLVLSTPEVNDPFMLLVSIQNDVYRLKRWITQTPDLRVAELAFYKQPSFVFSMNVKVGGNTLNCANGFNTNDTKAVADAQMAACKSIKAK